MEGKTREGQHLGIFGVIDVACVLVVVVITGILRVSELRELRTQDNQARTSLVVQWLRICLPYKINTQKSLAFLYTINEKSEREIKETIPFTITMKRIKYLGLNLCKETKDLYTENYKKKLMKETKDDRNRWRNVTISLDWSNQYSENDSTFQSNL